MADIIRMPRLSDTMQEGVIKSWLKKIGDQVKPGDILAEVETDKATMDLEAFQEGVLLHIAVASGGVPVEGIIAIIGKKGEDISNLLNSSSNSNSEVKQQESPIINKQTEAPAQPAVSNNGDRVKASPLAKNLAKAKGIEIQNIQGSGDQGRIIKRDIETIQIKASSPNMSQLISSDGDTEVPISQMRKTIARRLSESKFSAPHFYLTSEINMDACANAKDQLNKNTETKISYNDLIVKACALALRKNPDVNISWSGDKIVYHHDIHIGVAVAIEDGLVVPVIKHTDRKSIEAIKLEINDKAIRAKSKKLNLDEMQGNTFTISNLGMYDIEDFTAIINPPDACILAVGSVVKKPAVINDQITISNRMKVTLSCDHRAVDGATGAKFLQSLKSLLENPITMLL